VHFEHVDTLNAELDEEMKQLRVRRDQQVEQQRRQFEANAMIQKLYRGFITRKIVMVDKKKKR
jgi:hypothetical protein